MYIGSISIWNASYRVVIGMCMTHFQYFDRNAFPHKASEDLVISRGFQNTLSRHAARDSAWHTL